jgi:Phosphotransferase enzyme family
MGTSVPANMEVWRVVLLRKNACEFLVFETDSGLRLPTVEIPAYSRVALELNARIKTLWDLDVYSLYPIPAAEAAETARYHAVEVLHFDDPAPETARWISLSDAGNFLFSDRSDFAAVEAWRSSLSERNANGDLHPFEKPGWLSLLREVVQDAVRRIPLTLNGNFVQFTAGTSCSLIRFDTDHEAVWFKAVGEPNAREFPLTVLLSSRLDGYLPEILATQPRWNAWIMPAVPGVPLSEAEDRSLWRNAARDLARLQIASVEIAGDVLDRKARDVRTGTLREAIEPFFALMRTLMEQQTKSAPPRLSPSELQTLESNTRDTLLALERERVPDTVGNLDLNPDNVIALSQSTVFLDWAETSVGHPFFSLAHLIEHRRIYARNQADWDEHMVEAYLAEWMKHLSFPNANRILCLALLLAVFAHAVSTDAWRDGRALRDSRLAGYYRSLTRRMKSYDERLRNGASRVSEMFC